MVFDRIVTSIDDLHRMMSRLPAEQPLSLTLIREQEAVRVEVRLRMEG